MKQQTYISYLEDQQNNVIDFHRWSYKKASTIERKLKEFYQNNKDYSYIKKDLEKTVQIAIYATPDGYSKENTPTLVIPIKNLLHDRL